MNRVNASRESQGLCYIIPAYHPDQKEHYYHLPSLLSRLADSIPIAVVVERGEAPITICSARFVTSVGGDDLGRGRRALRFLRITRGLARLGYHTFFLRYSRLATTLLLLLRFRYPIRIYYWASGQADLDVGQRSARDHVIALLNRLHFRWLVHNVDVVVTGPESMVEYMSKRWEIPPHKMRLLYNDVDTERFRPVDARSRRDLRRELGVSDDDFLVLFVHRLAVRRGSRLLIPIGEAIAEETGGRCRLIIVGDGPESTRLRHEVSESQYGDSFVLKGPVPNRQLPPLYQAADCFLMPSYEEGFPRVILEAMATGIPVVATRAGGTQDLLGAKYPYSADPGDVMSMVRHLSAFSRDAELRDEVGRNLRTRAEELFDTRVVASMLIDLLRRSG